MSHFTVMVIGPDIADQLQPFHEFECTGIRLPKTSTTGMDLMRIVINVVAKSSSRKSASHAALSLRRLKATVSRGEPL